MNVRTIAATLIVIGGIAAGTATAQATPSQDKGNTPTAVCHREGNGSSHTIVVDNDSVLHAHLRHGDSLGACVSVTPTGIPTASPTGTATPVVVGEQPEDPCFGVVGIDQHNQGPRPAHREDLFVQEADCGQWDIPPTSNGPGNAPDPVVTPEAAPVPFGPGIFGHYPQPTFDDFDITQITRLPHAGDGSLSD